MVTGVFTKIYTIGPVKGVMYKKVKRKECLIDLFKYITMPLSQLSTKTHSLPASSKHDPAVQDIQLRIN